MADERVGHAGHGKVPMTVGRVGRIDHGKTSLTAAIASVLAEDEREGVTVIPDRIYFDMDGVLADFDMGVRELACFEKHYAQGESEEEEEDDLMWEAVRKVGHFYDRLEPIPGAVGLFRNLHALYGNRCEILTGVPTPRRGMPESGDDKRAWCRRLLPAGVKVNVVYRKDKPRFCRGKGSILIDDYHRNIREWESHGGTGILFVSADETRKVLHDRGVL